MHTPGKTPALVTLFVDDEVWMEHYNIIYIFIKQRHWKLTNIKFTKRSDVPESLWKQNKSERMQSKTRKQNINI